MFPEFTVPMKGWTYITATEPVIISAMPMPGEWCEYTVSVANEGAYNADFILASLQGGGTFKVKIGEVESDTLTALNTNSALNTKAVSTVMNLAAGVQIMRFTILTQPAFNIDQFKFSRGFCAYRYQFN